MARSVRFHPAARAQLFDLYDYIANEAGSARARGYLDRLEASCLRLADFPAMGRVADDLGPGLRLHPVDRRAIIVYRVTAETVDVLGVYHGGQDLAALSLDPPGGEDRDAAASAPRETPTKGAKPA